MSRETFLPILFQNMEIYVQDIAIWSYYLLSLYHGELWSKIHRMISMFVALALEIMNGWLTVKSTLTYHFFMSFENIAPRPHHFQWYWKDVFDIPPWLKNFDPFTNHLVLLVNELFQLTFFYKMPKRKMFKLWRIIKDNIYRFCSA